MKLGLVIFLMLAGLFVANQMESGKTVGGVVADASGAIPHAIPRPATRAKPGQKPRANASPTRPRLRVDPGAPASRAALTAVAAAKTKLGKPYRWGAEGPDEFDCSGLMMWAYARAGVSIPRVARDQYTGLPKIPNDHRRFRPGDLLFKDWNGRVPNAFGHVGMYIGNGQVIQAPSPGEVVKLTPVSAFGSQGATRPTK